MTLIKKLGSFERGAVIRIQLWWLERPITHHLESISFEPIHCAEALDRFTGSIHSIHSRPPVPYRAREPGLNLGLNFGLFLHKLVPTQPIQSCIAAQGSGDQLQDVAGIAKAVELGKGEFHGPLSADATRF
jgi:hypothetical protein